MTVPSSLEERRVRITAVQYMMRKINDFGEFARQAGYFVDVAAEYESHFVLFPELLTTQLMSFLPSQDPKEQMARLTEFTGRYVEMFQALARQFSINIVAGSHPTRRDDGIHNVAYLFMKDGTVHTQDKLHITPNEARWWGMRGGNTLEVFETDRVKVGILICYDCEFPELGRLLADRGVEILFVPFCTDERQGYLRVRYCAQARAIENNMFVAIAGNVGNLPDVENMDIQYAQSAIFTPSDFMFARDGIAAEVNPNVETVLVCDVNATNIVRSRESGTVAHLRDRRRDLYEVVWRGRR
jgi:predicted amidohydrolase